MLELYVPTQALSTGNSSWNTNYASVTTKSNWSLYDFSANQYFNFGDILAADDFPHYNTIATGGQTRTRMAYSFVPFILVNTYGTFVYDVGFGDISTTPSASPYNFSYSGGALRDAGRGWNSKIQAFNDSNFGCFFVSQGNDQLSDPVWNLSNTSIWIRSQVFRNSLTWATPSGNVTSTKLSLDPENLARAIDWNWSSGKTITVSTGQMASQSYVSRDWHSAANSLKYGVSSTLSGRAKLDPNQYIWGYMYVFCTDDGTNDPIYASGSFIPGGNSYGILTHGMWNDIDRQNMAGSSPFTTKSMVWQSNINVRELRVATFFGARKVG